MGRAEGRGPEAREPRIGSPMTGPAVGPTDHPRKIVSMNKFLSAIALGAGLILATASAPAARASAIQTLDEQGMTASQFDALFRPMAASPAMTSTYQYVDAPASGTVGSQVFQGIAGTAAAGLYAYGYDLTVNRGTTNLGEPLHTDSASFQFGATPMAADLLGSGKSTYAYAVTDGPIGGLAQPQAAPGESIAVPQVSYQAGSKIATVRTDFVNPAAGTPPLDAGANSSIFVLLSDKPPTTQLVNLQSSLPTTGTPPAVYAPTGGAIQPIPSPVSTPEPAAVMAWAGMAGATLLVRRVRKGRA